MTTDELRDETLRMYRRAGERLQHSSLPLQTRQQLADMMEQAATLLDPDTPGERRAFYRAVEEGRRADAASIAWHLAASAVSLRERKRWHRWREALLRPGGRIVIKSYPAQVIAGDELRAVEQLRAAATPADLGVEP